MDVAQSISIHIAILLDSSLSDRERSSHTAEQLKLIIDLDEPSAADLLTIADLFICNFNFLSLLRAVTISKPNHCFCALLYEKSDSEHPP